MPGITTALVVFILAGVAVPAMIKNKSQFYIAVAFVALAILVSPFEPTFFRFLVAILQVLAFVALVLCAGGLEWGEFTDHMANACDAMRYGDRTKPVIVPRTSAPKTEAADVSPETIITPPPPPPAVLESIPIEPATSENKNADAPDATGNPNG